MSNVVVVRLSDVHAGTLRPDLRSYRVIRIDRKTAFGNPFKAPTDADRPAAIEQYRKYLWKALQDPKSDLGRRVRHLAATNADLALACWCAPKPCHGDVLKSAIMWLRAQDTQPAKVPPASPAAPQPAAVAPEPSEVERMIASTRAWNERCAAEDRAAEDKRIADLWAVKLGLAPQPAVSLVADAATWIAAHYKTAAPAIAKLDAAIAALSTNA